uniref:Uncharacterized protein n=1 Tax=Romanomermis culicivorax TaxID=13658 RepID=A0A915KHE9_ROMCU
YQSRFRSQSALTQSQYGENKIVPESCLRHTNFESTRRHHTTKALPKPEILGWQKRYQQHVQLFLLTGTYNVQCEYRFVNNGAKKCCWLLECTDSRLQRKTGDTGNGLAIVAICCSQTVVVSDWGVMLPSRDKQEQYFVVPRDARKIFPSITR